MPRVIRRSNVGPAAPVQDHAAAPAAPAGNGGASAPGSASVQTPAATPPAPGTVAGIAAEPIKAGDLVSIETESAKFRSFLANAVTGVFGITGAGKSSLADTAAEEAWDTYGAITLCYASDLGGFGTKRLSLIRHGIMRVWYMRNHVNPFDTMQFASLGYWPESLIDPEAGLAAPNVKLIAPVVTKYTLVCPNGHDVVSYTDQGQVQAAQASCPTCGQLTSVQNAQGIRRTLVRPAMFRRVGHRIYDSMTQITEWASSELQNKSARGDLPSGASGGAALGSADALREEAFVFGTGSKAQVGFVQNRVPEWIANIRAIQGQVIPATMTFGVEVSKGDDESGGQVILGPKIPGQARTSSVPGWLGNCLYAAREVKSNQDIDVNTGVVKMYHRLWLTTHVDPRDPRAIPIVAKHRGEPIGMPLVLEDPYIDIDPTTGVPKNPDAAWSRCSLRVFYGLLRQQAEVIEARDAKKFTHTPTPQDDGEDEVLEIGSLGDTAPTSMPINSSRVIRRSRRPGSAPAPAAGASPSPATNPTATSGPGTEEPGTTAAAQTAPGTPVPEVVTGSPAVANGGMQTPAPSPLTQQLTASLEHETAKRAEPNVATAAPVAQTPAPPAPATSSGAHRIMRRPRPPA